MATEVDWFIDRSVVCATVQQDRRFSRGLCSQSAASLLLSIYSELRNYWPQHETA